MWPELLRAAAEARPRPDRGASPNRGPTKPPTSAGLRPEADDGVAGRVALHLRPEVSQPLNRPPGPVPRRERSAERRQAGACGDPNSCAELRDGGEKSASQSSPPSSGKAGEAPSKSGSASSDLLASPKSGPADAYPTADRLWVRRLFFPRQLLLSPEARMHCLGGEAVLGGWEEATEPATDPLPSSNRARPCRGKGTSERVGSQKRSRMARLRVSSASSNAARALAEQELAPARLPPDAAAPGWWLEAADPAQETADARPHTLEPALGGGGDTEDASVGSDGAVATLLTAASAGWLAAAAADDGRARGAVCRG
mmetsp:Transcript_5883/g.24768  ORF Transcript_5883/g.24768 Transcript_5883/m.24768 type:complete len:314 (-) Transcript_5883:1373-2314(-)